MKCALCKNERELCKSHIIPEFMYKTLYDKKHRFFALSTESSLPNPYKQKGLREKLLCRKCEQIIGKWETYFSHFLEGKLDLHIQNSGSFFIIEQLDYTKFKLFQLSVLWRASVSTLPFFKEVNLGPHENIIRKMLQSENPGEYDQYGCQMFAIRFQNQRADFIIRPTDDNLEGYRFYRFIFGGFSWAYFVTSHGIPLIWKDYVLNKKERLIIPIAIADNQNFLKQFFRDLKRKGKMPNIP